MDERLKRAGVGTVSDPAFIRVGDFLARAVDTFPQLDIELLGEKAVLRDTPALHHPETPLQLGAALLAVQQGLTLVIPDRPASDYDVPWDDGPPWEFWLKLTPGTGKAKGYEIRGELRRGEIGRAHV